MFRKQLNDLKTSAPLKNSERKKLRQRVLQDFGLGESTELGDTLVPEGLQSIKFTAHNAEPGIAYLSGAGEPLWFSLGKGSNDLIPTVYTLWNYPLLLPFLSTPPAVIPKLYGGADLMIAGVVERVPGLAPGQLVSVKCYYRDKEGPPLAVGHMAVADGQLQKDGAKGKAVHILHTHKDKLWEMGGQGEPPEPVSREPDSEDEAGEEGQDGLEKKLEGVSLEDGAASQTSLQEPAQAGVPAEDSEDAPATLSPEEVSSILQTSLIQAIRSSLGSLPATAYPMPATTFYSAHILPARPAHPPFATPIDIKHSSFKNLTAFLRAAEKDGLIRLKEARGKNASGDAQVLGVAPPVHVLVAAHRVYRSLGDEEAKREKRQGKEAAKAARPREIVVTELWKPHQQSVALFEQLKKDKSALYTMQEFKAAVNEYIAKESLVNAHQQAFINIDLLLRAVLTSKVSEVPEFMKRDELGGRLLDKMQPWHRIEADGKDPSLKKGKLEPIQVVAKIRQGRKACTLITGFEPYFLAADDLAEELRQKCASSTSVNPLPGKSAGLEVMVQGKQIKTVADLLMARGVPKKWVVAEDLTGKKK